MRNQGSERGALRATAEVISKIIQSTPTQQLRICAGKRSSLGRYDAVQRPGLYCYYCGRREEAPSVVASHLEFLVPAGT